MLTTERDRRATILGIVRHESRSSCAGVRTLAIGGLELGDLHLLCLQLLQASLSEGLANSRLILRLRGRAVYGDVRLPADDLPAVGVAAGQVSGCGLPQPRRRPPLVPAPRIRWRSSLESDSCLEHRGDRVRVLPSFGFLEGALSGADGRSPSYVWAVREGPPSSICGLCRDHARISPPVADARHAADVPGARGCVRPSRASRRAGG